MVVYGFLNYENGLVSIPNKELMEKFNDALMKEPSLGYVHRLSAQSERMLKATKAGDTIAMAEILEDKGGIGYVDFIFYPAVNMDDDCILLELNFIGTAEQAVQHIKEKKYALAFAPKVGEPLLYTGRKLAVGIGYDTKSKKLECRVEILEDLL